MSLNVLTPQLKKAFDEQDYSLCLKLLPKIKVELARFNLLVPVTSSDGKKFNPEDLLVTRYILEIGALASINLKDYKGFQNYINQLKPFYKQNFKKNLKSQNQKKIMALYLLLLLSRGEIATFHIELISLPNKNLDLKEIENDLYLNYPIKIERWLMEGSYDKIWKLINDNNSSKQLKEFQIFNSDLIKAIRLEIIDCIEKTYENKKLALSNVKNLLFLNNEREVIDLINEETNWVLQNGFVYF
ncbi:proteasome regulatory particle lid subunit RPN12, partial [Ascoidea rubescens DSM 1968]